MKKQHIVLASIILLVVLASFSSLLFASSNSRDNQDPARRNEMMVMVLEWGRLAPIPASATNLSINTEGNGFTRSFRMRFVAPEHDILSWIKDSPGLQETTPEELSSTKLKYNILPGGGANSAEVTIDFTLNQGEIYVSWG